MSDGNLFSGLLANAPTTTGLNSSFSQAVSSGNILQSVENLLGFGGLAAQKNDIPDIVISLFAIGEEHSSSSAFYFYATEVPETIPLGGVQVSHVHQFIHDPVEANLPENVSSPTLNANYTPGRTIDVFGGQPHSLVWSGTIFTVSDSDDKELSEEVSKTPGLQVSIGTQTGLAIDRMLKLDTYRVSGTHLKLYWGDYIFEGVITEFTPVIHHVNLVEYTLKFEILKDNLHEVNPPSIQSNVFKFKKIEASFADNLINLFQKAKNLANTISYLSSFAASELNYIASNPKGALTGLAYFSPVLGGVLDASSAAIYMGQTSGKALVSILQIFDPNLLAPSSNLTGVSKWTKNFATPPANTNLSDLQTISKQASTQLTAYRVMSDQDVTSSDLTSASGTVTDYKNVLTVFQAAINQFFNNLFLQFQVDMDQAKPITTLTANSILTQIIPEINQMRSILEFILRVSGNMTYAYSDPAINATIMNDGYEALGRLHAIRILFMELVQPIHTPTITVNNPNLYLLALEYYGDIDKWQLIAQANNISTPEPKGLVTLRIPPNPSGTQTSIQPIVTVPTAS